MLNKMAFMDLEKQTDTENVVEEEEAKGIAMELLHEFKENNKRIDEHNKKLISVIKHYLFLLQWLLWLFS